MDKYEKIYTELRKQYSDEEIAESMMIPQDMTVAERKSSNEEIKAFRFKLLRERTKDQQIFSDLMRLRFQMENYIDKEAFTPEKSFGVYLSEYIRILNRTKKSLSEDLAIHYTRLSRIFNDREDPNIEFIYRLEKHAGNLIPAVLWWKLVVKKQEYVIKKDNETRIREAAKVESVLKFTA